MIIIINSVLFFCFKNPTATTIYISHHQIMPAKPSSKIPSSLSKFARVDDHQDNTNKNKNENDKNITLEIVSRIDRLRRKNERRGHSSLKKEQFESTSKSRLDQLRNLVNNRHQSNIAQTFYTPTTTTSTSFGPSSPSRRLSLVHAARNSGVSRNDVATVDASMRQSELSRNTESRKFHLTFAQGSQSRLNAVRSLIPK